jgi:acyl carrier protein
VNLIPETDISRDIVDLCRSLFENDNRTILAEMSLAHDLAFDSVKLVQFFAGVETLFPGIALEDWFIEHSSSGQDTIRNVVAYLARFFNHRAVEG